MRCSEPCLAVGALFKYFLAPDLLYRLNIPVQLHLLQCTTVSSQSEDRPSLQHFWILGDTNWMGRLFLHWNRDVRHKFRNFRKSQCNFSKTKLMDGQKRECVWERVQMSDLHFHSPKRNQSIPKKPQKTHESRYFTHKQVMI